MARTDLTDSSDIADNSHKGFTVEGTDILIARTPLGLFAVNATCTHQQTSLEGGKQKACFLFCPLHGLRFDLRDGSPTGNLTDTPLPTYACGEEDGRIWVDLETPAA